jgi:hypothetical protein
MPTIAQDFNWGSAVKNENPELARQLSQAYGVTARSINDRPAKYFTDGIQKPNVNPPANDPFNQNFEIGDIYIRTDTNSVWMMTSRTSSTAVTWTPI